MRHATSFSPTLRTLATAFSLLLLASAGGLVTGCGDDPVAAGTGNGNGNGNGNNNNNNNGTGDPSLVLVSSADPIISFSEQHTIRVQYLDGNEVAVPNAFLSFTADGTQSDAVLSASNASTDTSGIAEVNVNAGVQVADFNVTVAVSDNDTVTPVVVRVRVQPKDTSDYVLRVTYDGPIRMHEVEVSFYTSTSDCDDVTPHWEDAPTSDSAFMSQTVLPNAEGGFEDHSFSAPDSAAFTYAVARAEPRGATPTEGIGYYVALGCNDEIPANTPGSPTIIEIDLGDLWPEVAGTYRIHSEINLVDAIPDDAQETVDAIILIFDQPGLGLLKLVAIAWYELNGPEYAEGDSCNPDTETCTELEYWEASPWDSFFTESDGQIVAGGTWGTLAVGALNALVETALATAGSFNETITDLVDAIDDLLENAQNFTLIGDIVLAQDADPDGSLGRTNEVRFNQLSLMWDGAEYSFFFRDGVLVEAEDVSASIVFDPNNDQGYALQLDPFGVEIHYGDLIIWLIENAVFPRFLEDDSGDPITSFEDFFASIIDCEAIAQEIEDATATGVGAPAQSACENFRGVAVDALESWVRSQTADIGNFVRLATPEDTPCPAGFSSTSDEFVVNSLGGEDLDACQWDGEVQHSTDALSHEDLDGIWWGDRL